MEFLIVLILVVLFARPIDRIFFDGFFSALANWTEDHRRR